MAAASLSSLPKARTGIEGLDEITDGGFPAGRPTLICGGPGCGKTLFGLTFLVEGITAYHEKGVLITFEERADDMNDNVMSLGYDLNGLIEKKQLVIDFVKIDRN